MDERKVDSVTVAPVWGNDATLAPLKQSLSTEGAVALANQVLAATKQVYDEVRLAYVLTSVQHPLWGDWVWQIVTPNEERMWLTAQMLTDCAEPFRLMGSPVASVYTVQDQDPEEPVQDIAIVVGAAPPLRSDLLPGIALTGALRAEEGLSVVLCAVDPVPTWPR